MKKIFVFDRELFRCISNKAVATEAVEVDPSGSSSSFHTSWLIAEAKLSMLLKYECFTSPKVFVIKCFSWLAACSSLSTPITWRMGTR